MDAKSFAKRNEGKNWTKQKRETTIKQSNLKEKTNINKQNIAYLSPIPLFRQLFS